MGLYMSSPCREVDAEEGIGNNLQYAVGEMQVCPIKTLYLLSITGSIRFFDVKCRNREMSCYLNNV